MFSESDEGVVSDLDQTFAKDLHNLPHVLKFIHKLCNRIDEQQKTIDQLQKEVKKKKNSPCIKTYIDCGIQTNLFDFNELSQDWDVNHDIESSSIVEQVKRAAESALLQTGFVYEQTSGMYYDYTTGYYYDTKQGLYYDGNTGTYYYYDESSNTYQFHSQIYVNNIPTHSLILPEKKKYEKTYKDNVKKRKFKNEEENSQKEEDKEPEEGECSESERETDNTSYEIIPDVSTSSESDDEDQDLAKNYPPCMRIIVKETDLEELKLGSLFLVTYTGGSLGREGDHSVLIPDINISKYHARFVYNETRKRYQVIDSGSRNGTFIDGKRLSVAKQESKPHEIIHGSVIKIGGTKLLCHIHNGNETCGHCEPGLVQRNVNLSENKASKKKLYKEELRRLKYKFGIDKDNVAFNCQLSSNYQDRAQARRLYVGSSDPHAKTQQSSIHTSITKDNIGFKLLSKMGWSEGRSLGKDGDGRTEPLPLMYNHNKVGLGSNKMDFPNIELDSNVEKKQTVWRKTQKRYKEIMD
ncbi:angiogenic factor with G patch and FHA domains 1 isoform X1 [Pogonomyrmex barbatus]|uniref:Angiogenic factor with G patch and FHA domains 1 isoform X1 n=1 Tax=Pogonomyrmex barbatus TaxID=144034 RepID=A0A6I9WNJ6_9HYME|nr:angiogenic factor with G patch and FHA domains 1 isoform X1 [Pogonomyrmex barbatus]XP_011644653.1 angiogenic factor with G patch and FHA domains 1 isoform X1 [Pogonomyrmex barbatus]XP_025075341.1 angiogenic factor with G patch and FHA domains 1 isoform X1 [Pogonomyrmex barbatus]